MVLTELTTKSDMRFRRVNKLLVDECTFPAMSVMVIATLGTGDEKVKAGIWTKTLLLLLKKHVMKPFKMGSEPMTIEQRGEQFHHAKH